LPPSRCCQQKIWSLDFLPPPEEEKDVKTAIGAARAKMARKELLEVISRLT
jgi:hypothetical protein